MTFHSYFVILAVVLSCLLIRINSQRDERRYLVALLENKQYFCAGSLVSMQLVITIATCLNDVNPKVIDVIANSVNFPQEGRKGEKVFYVGENRKCNTDIAGLKLNEPFKDNKVKTISLCKNELPERTQMEIIGWTDQTNTRPGFELIKQDVTTVAPNQCVLHLYGSSMYCAKYHNEIRIADAGAAGVVSGQLCAVGTYSDRGIYGNFKLYANVADPKVRCFIQRWIGSN